jgi:hypothetical protein
MAKSFGDESVLKEDSKAIYAILILRVLASAGKSLSYRGLSISPTSTMDFTRQEALVHVNLR